MNNHKTLAAAVFALLLTAACGTSGNTIGDILGGGANNGQQATYSLRGTVDSVDTNGRSIYLTNVTGLNNNLRDSNGSSGSSVRLYYDDRTTINFQGRNYRPEDLERGDEITVRAGQNGNQLIAESMDVTYNSRGGMASSSNGTYGTYPNNTNNYPSNNSNSYATYRGTVRSVDTSNRTIELENTTWMSGFQTNNSGSRLIVRYDPNASVEWQGQMNAVSGLERGDVVDVQVTNLGSSNYLAQRITLVRNVRQ